MKNLILTIIIATPFLLFGQGWERTYGGSYSDIGKSIQITTDGGYIIIGSTKSFGNGDYDFWLIKTDMNGDSLWSKTYGTVNDDFGNSVQQTTDGGYIITGTYDTPIGQGSGEDIFLIKTDSNGYTLWTKMFGGIEEERGKSVQQTADGGYIIVGNTGPNIYPKTYLIKTNSNGDT